jgi:glycosyltransferase involved in cell wall biosynthesis
MTTAHQLSLADVRIARRPFQRPILVLPACNAATTLRATIEDVARNAASEIILVDDCSDDDTVAIARSLGLTVIQHDRRRGYGANQKTCYDAALERGADVVVMLHPDYQYDARLIPYFLGFMEMGICDVMLGSRVRSRREALACGMPPYKYVSNRLLTIIENTMLGQNLGEFHSGFRLYTREVLETIPYRRNSDDFVFDTEMLVQAVYFGFRLADAPVPCRYFAEASSINLRRSLTYGWQTLMTVGRYLLQKGRLARFPMFVRNGQHGAG